MYGDGVFETILCEGGKPILLAGHIQRLINGCERLELPAIDQATVLSEIRNVAQQDDCIIKIIITRGIRHRGYAYDTNDKASTRIVARSSLSEIPLEYYDSGIRVRSCQYRLPNNAHLAGIKHLNRLDQVMARNEWESDYQEGLMLDQDDLVIEGTMTNVFIEKNKQWITPVLDKSGVKGVMRQWIMRNSHFADIECCEDKVSLLDVESADSIFVCNSVVGIWPVTHFDGHEFSVSESVRRIMKVVNSKLTNMYPCQIDA